MDYLKRLEETVDKFEAESDKLTKINVLIQNISNLLGEVEREKNILSKSVQHLANLQGKIESDCKSLSNYTAKAEKLQAKNISDVHNTVVKDSKKIIDDLSKPLEKVELQLIEDCEQLHKLIDTHQKTQEKFLSDIENLLIKYNAKNLEVYNSIIDTISNKIRVANDSTETNFTLKFNTINKNISSLNENLAQTKSDLNEKMGRELKTLAEEIKNSKIEIETLKTPLASVGQIKIAAYLAVVVGIVSCIIAFFK